MHSYEACMECMCMYGGLYGAHMHSYEACMEPTCTHTRLVWSPADDMATWVELQGLTSICSTGIVQCSEVHPWQHVP